MKQYLVGRKTIIYSTPDSGAWDKTSQSYSFRTIKDFRINGWAGRSDINDFVVKNFTDGKEKFPREVKLNKEKLETLLFAITHRKLENYKSPMDLDSKEWDGRHEADRDESVVRMAMEWLEAEKEPDTMRTVCFCNLIE